LKIIGIKLEVIGIMWHIMNWIRILYSGELSYLRYLNYGVLLPGILYILNHWLNYLVHYYNFATQSEKQGNRTEW